MNLNYWSISSKILTKEAEKLWLSVKIVSKDNNLFFINWNWKSVLFKSTDFWVNSSLWTKISDNKELTYKMLETQNIPTAKSWYISKLDHEILDNQDITFPVIIKPLQESGGNWVVMNILNHEELKEKLQKSFQSYKKMIIQRQIEWKEYRIIIFNWKLLIAYNRDPASIFWNWINTIEELIALENNNPLRSNWYDSPLSLIEIDEELLNYITKQWLSVKSIPIKDDKIYLRWNSNIWTGWIPVDASKEISQSIINSCVQASKILWLSFSCVDVITTDIKKSLKETNGIILEAWSTPWIWWVLESTWINIWKKILQQIFFQ